MVLNRMKVSHIYTGDSTGVYAEANYTYNGYGSTLGAKYIFNIDYPTFQFYTTGTASFYLKRNNVATPT